MGLAGSVGSAVCRRDVKRPGGKVVRRRFRGPVVARLGVSRYQQEDVRNQCETKLLEGWVYLPLVKSSGGSFAASGQILLPTEATGTAPSDFTGTQEFTSRGRLTKDGSAE